MQDNSRPLSRLIGGIYRTGQIIHAGGMLKTYTAYNRNTNDVVGLFVIEFPPDIAPEQVQQFLQPIEKRRSLQSQHIIHIHNWGIDGNRIYIATDPPRGVTLQHVLDNENIDIKRSIDLTSQMALGLTTLHAQGISGLDMRPQLITVDTVGIIDRIQIDDIGLRTLLHELGYMSNPQDNDIGYLDPSYAPPEYIYGGKTGTWSDTYQLGLLLFNLITGRLPFIGRTQAETGVLQSTSPIPQMQQFQHEVTASLQKLLEQMLAKEPARRFTDANALIKALNEVHKHIVPSAPDLTIVVKGRERPTKPNISDSPTTEMDALKEKLALIDTVIQKNAAPDTSLHNVPTPGGVYAYLSYDKSATETLRFEITQKSIIIGRMDPKSGLSPDIDLTKIDLKMRVSRQHARIRFEGTFFYIEDLKSRNKTRLGSTVLTPLKPELIQHGDVVYFGNVHLRFEVPAQPEE